MINKEIEQQMRRDRDEIVKLRNKLEQEEKNFSKKYLKLLPEFYKISVNDYNNIVIIGTTNKPFSSDLAIERNLHGRHRFILKNTPEDFIISLDYVC